MKQQQSLETFRDMLEYLYRFIDYERKENIAYDAYYYDLQRFRDMVSLFGNPEKNLRCVHIAGTKGKGSTAVVIAAILQATGYKTGLFTSPHLIDLRERFRINGLAISVSECLAIMNEIINKIEVDERNRYRTVFELMTLLSFIYFSRNKTDWSVFEVGMGGRLDSTNIITPQVTIITPISRDHVQSLGSTVGKIAREKAGIIKPHVPVICAGQLPEALAVIRARAKECNTEFIYVPEITRVWEKNDEGVGGRFDLEIGGNMYRNLKLALPGRFQIENAVTAISALYMLHRSGLIVWDEEAIRYALTHVRWPGRLQLIEKKYIPPVYSNIDAVRIDGAHNPMAARKLSKELNRCFPQGNIDLIIGVPSNKDGEGIVRELAPMAGRIIVTRYRNPRSLPVEALFRIACRYHNQVVSTDDIHSALMRAGSTVVVTGSLLLAGEVLSRLNLKDSTVDLWNWEKEKR